MNDAHFMKVPNSVYDGHQNLAGLPFRIMLLLHDAVEQFTSRHQFEHQIELFFVFINLVEFNNIWVVDLL
jgi:hypothetical protein